MCLHLVTNSPTSASPNELRNEFSGTAVNADKESVTASI